MTKNQRDAIAIRLRVSKYAALTAVCSLAAFGILTMIFPASSGDARIAFTNFQTHESLFVAVQSLNIYLNRPTQILGWAFAVWLLSLMLPAMRRIWNILAAIASILVIAALVLSRVASGSAPRVDLAVVTAVAFYGFITAYTWLCRARTLWRAVSMAFTATSLFVSIFASIYFQTFTVAQVCAALCAGVSLAAAGIIGVTSSARGFPENG